MREWEWSERYPGPPEILRYLNHVADRFDLKRDIRFNTRVSAAHYDEAANLWRVSTEAGETLDGAVPDHRRGLPVLRQHPEHSGPRDASPGAGITPGNGRTKVSISPASASA